MSASRLLLLAAVVLFVIAAILVASSATLALGPIFWIAVGLACLAASRLA